MTLACISPRYCKIKVPGLRSFEAKSPDCPLAGWAGEVMGVILPRLQGPLGVLAGFSGMSRGRVRRAVRWAGVRDGE